MNTLADLMEYILKVAPNAEVSEDTDGEIRIHTRLKIISSDEHLAPIGERHE